MILFYLVSCIVCLVIGMVVGYQTRGAEGGHKHRWVPRDVTHVNGNLQGPMTQVLSTCSCGDRDVDTLNGHWRLQDLLVDMSDEDREAIIDDLRKIGDDLA